MLTLLNSRFTNIGLGLREAQPQQCSGLLFLHMPSEAICLAGVVIVNSEKCGAAKCALFLTWILTQW